MINFYYAPLDLSYSSVAARFSLFFFPNLRDYEFSEKALLDFPDSLIGNNLLEKIKNQFRYKTSWLIFYKRFHSYSSP
jgi:hypothetical protein